jgi:hypothetical protein
VSDGRGRTTFYMGITRPIKAAGFFFSPAEPEEDVFDGDYAALACNAEPFGDDRRCNRVAHHVGPHWLRVANT